MSSLKRTRKKSPPVASNALPGLFGPSGTATRSCLRPVLPAIRGPEPAVPIPGTSSGQHHGTSPIRRRASILSETLICFRHGAEHNPSICHSSMILALFRSPVHRPICRSRCACRSAAICINKPILSAPSSFAHYGNRKVNAASGSVQDITIGQKLHEGSSFLPDRGLARVDGSRSAQYRHSHFLQRLPREGTAGCPVDR